MLEHVQTKRAEQDEEGQQRQLQQQQQQQLQAAPAQASQRGRKDFGDLCKAQSPIELYRKDFIDRESGTKIATRGHWDRVYEGFTSLTEKERQHYEWMARCGIGKTTSTIRTQTLL
jgi:hypothetical protein